METNVRPISIILKEELLKRQSKNEGYSLRAFSKTLGLSSSFVSKVLNGKKNISEKTFLTIMNRLKLEEKTIDELTFHFAKNKEGLDFVSIDLDHFQMICDWQHYALLELVTLNDFQSDLNWISEKLNISYELAQQTLQRLIKLGLLKEDLKGNIVSTLVNLTTSNQNMSAAQTEHERQVLKKAIEALDETEKIYRSQSSMTMAIPESRLKEAREKITQFQRDITALLQRKGKRDSVYQLSISFFPLTPTKKLNKNPKRSIK